MKAMSTIVGLLTFTNRIMNSGFQNDISFLLVAIHGMKWEVNMQNYWILIFFLYTNCFFIFLYNLLVPYVVKNVRVIHTMPACRSHGFQLPKTNSCIETQVQIEFYIEMQLTSKEFITAISEKILFTYRTIFQKQLALISSYRHLQ